LSEEYNVGPWLDIFFEYHNCTDKPAIVHGNGDSLIYTYKRKK
jgi:hypothetical protein